MGRWWIGWVLAALVAGTSVVAAAETEDVAREEAERLRADLEGESERLRLTLETFMQQQDARLGERLAEQDRRLARQDRMVWGLGGACLALAALSGGLSWCLRRRGHRPGSR